jgi:hypothetical protein
MDAPPPAAEPASAPAPLPLPRPSPLRQVAIVLKVAAVAGFVLWQLFFLVVRNPLDFWYKPLKGWLRDEDLWDSSAKFVVDPADDATTYYGDYTGIDQNWKMFTPPLARTATFLGVRVEFADGTSDVVASENEPADPQSYFRYGGWRQRKLEDQMAFSTPGSLWGEPERALWEAYARWSLRRWKAAHPNDPRTVTHVVLIGRRFTFPKPDEDPSAVGGPEESTGGTFLPDGTLEQ